MPMVNGKKFPYTAKGKADAAAAQKKKPDPALSYTADRQRGDKQSVQDYYAKKYDKTIKDSYAVIKPRPFGIGAASPEKDQAAERLYNQTKRKKSADMAYQNSYIAKGAMANKEALKRVAAKKKSGASGGWEEMTGMTRAQKIAEMRKAGVSEAAIKAALGG
jgi:hypothetical protein